MPVPVSALSPACSQLDMKPERLRSAGSLRSPPTLTLHSAHAVCCFLQASSLHSGFLLLRYAHRPVRPLHPTFARAPRPHTKRKQQQWRKIVIACRRFLSVCSNVILHVSAWCPGAGAALQTGRYPIRTGCMGNAERNRVVPTPSNPSGLDPATQLSVAAAVKRAGYATGMAGKVTGGSMFIVCADMVFTYVSRAVLTHVSVCTLQWHLGINGNTQPGSAQDHRFLPVAHGYDSYLGAPWTNAPMCAMDDDGVSAKWSSGPNFCFMMRGNQVVEMPLRLENFTAHITGHALRFLENQAVNSTFATATGQAVRPWYFLQSYFHVHTPLFTNRTNRGRSHGGVFGDNVEELDDSVGAIIAALHQHSFWGKQTLIFLTSDNGPYQEEGWDHCGRGNIYSPDGKALLGRLKGGKGQVYEGGIRMPGAVVWPGFVTPQQISDTFVSTLDIFPTILAVAGVSLHPEYAATVDGKSMMPILTGGTTHSQHKVFFHYCGFQLIAARVDGRWKVFWATQKWYTHDSPNASVCVQCCNGINPYSLLYAPATELCGCTEKELVWAPRDQPLVFDMLHDRLEQHVLTAENWPDGSGTSFEDVVFQASVARKAMETRVHPTPTAAGAGRCTAGLPAAWRQPCCPGCSKAIADAVCVDVSGKNCSCAQEYPNYKSDDVV
eukprot:SAG31_NODE_1500_length_8090_cov_10.522588_12_plen_665_part_00